MDCSAGVFGGGYEDASPDTARVALEYSEFSAMLGAGKKSTHI